jgi:hypothetical protein
MWLEMEIHEAGVMKGLGEKRKFFHLIREYTVLGYSQDRSECIQKLTILKFSARLGNGGK